MLGLGRAHDRSPIHEEVLFRCLSHRGVLEAEARGEMNDSQLAALTEEQRELLTVWRQDIPEDDLATATTVHALAAQDILIFATALADARLEVAELKAERAIIFESRARIERAEHGALAEVAQLDAQRNQAYQQLAYWWKERHSCPCGARPESPDTHPHVPTCPTGDAVRWLAEHVETERDRQREDIRRLMEALWAELHDHDTDGCEPGWPCGPQHTLLAEMKERYV